MFNNLKKVFGFNDDLDNQDYDYLQEEPGYNSNCLSSEPEKFTDRDLFNATNNYQVSIFKPESIEDAAKIIEQLKQNKICVVNLENIERTLFSSIKDHIQGATYYCNGKMYILTAQVFMFLPNIYTAKEMNLQSENSGTLI